MNFDVTTEQVGDSTFVIALTGEVDLYTAPEFKQQLLDTIAKGAKNVVVDLSGTTFIDSTTLGVLVGGVKRLRGQEGQPRWSAATATSRRSRDHRSGPCLPDLSGPRRGARGRRGVTQS